MPTPTKPTKRRLKDYFGNIEFACPQHRQIARILLDQAIITKIDGKNFIDVKTGWLITSLDCRKFKPAEQSPE